MKQLIFTFLILLNGYFLIAQKIDNTVSYLDMGTDKYFRFNYDNDFFSAADFNYTQGYNFEFVNPVLAKNPLQKLLLKKKSINNYGLLLEGIGYTPFDIVESTIILDDRPFASALMLRSFVTSTDTVLDYRLTSSLSLGIIGPVTGGREVQTAIHKIIDDDIPQGWKNEIQNDLVLNYELGVEKKVLAYRDKLVITTSAKAKFGTLFNSLTLSSSISTGVFNSVFITPKREYKKQFYLYAEPLVNLVAYDATLQGGFLNDSPHTFAANEIERFVPQLKVGLVLKLKKLFLEYSQVIIGREYKFGPIANWGGVKIGGYL